MHPDSGKSGGFFNKVMNLVRGNAGVAAASGGSPEPDTLSAREVLQEAVVRKRRNEAIRQHEFAQLRLLRERSEMGAGLLQGPNAQDEGLPSLLGQETRSTETLQKIDAIEAQMSGQWWRQPAAAAGKGDPAIHHRKPNSRQVSDLPVLGEEAVVHSHAAVAPFGYVAPEASQVSSEPPAPVMAPVPVPAARVFKPHPDLEEAAILFAHGDLDGAHARLLEQLLQALGAAPADEEKIGVLWHSVLDLCRATGNEEAFESLAIDYAEHFGRSAPLWSSMPARLGLPVLGGTPRPSAPKRQFQWSCPAMLTVGAVTALRAAQTDAPQPWSMSWLRLSSIHEAALDPLTKLFDEWASSHGQFVLSDAGRLLQVLEAQTPEADGSRNPQWWALRMALLRFMHRMDAYEQVAVDYCIAYEVSPPSWTPPLCDCVVQEEGEADISILQDVSLYAKQAVAGHVQPVAVERSKELAGVIEGDPQAWLDALASQAQVGQELEIACERLIRVDFVAAGSVLNWAAEMQSKGYSLRFTQLHQLVAVFFCIIGIHEHAKVQATLA